MIPFLDEGRVRACLSYDELIPAMEQALIDFSSGRTTQPVRTIMPVPDHSGFFSIMPARYGNVMGAEACYFLRERCPPPVTNASRDHPFAGAATGESLAIMDGRLITEMRTAAVFAARGSRKARS